MSEHAAAVHVDRSGLYVALHAPRTSPCSCEAAFPSPPFSELAPFPRGRRAELTPPLRRAAPRPAPHSRRQLRGRGCPRGGAGRQQPSAAVGSACGGRLGGSRPAREAPEGRASLSRGAAGPLASLPRDAPAPYLGAAFGCAFPGPGLRLVSTSCPVKSCASGLVSAWTQRAYTRCTSGRVTSRHVEPAQRYGMYRDFPLFQQAQIL